MKLGTSAPKKVTKNPEDLKLTPHTLRLIRLITSSTTSSSSFDGDDHTQHAIALLSNIASKSHPLLLWDILARLYASLTEVNESDSIDRGGVGSDDCLLRRECIALAMEHVAKYIPSGDRRYFMREASCTPIKPPSSSSTNGSGSDKLWLTVQDLLPVRKDENTGTDGENWENLDQVLTNGRLLLSSNGNEFETSNVSSQSCHQISDYDREEATLRSLDTSALASSSTKEQDNLLRERIALQRKILASRLGFGEFLSMNISTKDIVADEDLTPSNVTLGRTDIKDKIPQRKLSARERNLQRIGKRKRNDDPLKNCSRNQDKKSKHFGNIDTSKNIDNRNNNDDEEEDEGEKLTIRNILLLSLNHQEKFTSYDKSRDQTSLVSHRTPQNVLATDMIYNSLHPSWHVRHGSLLGLLALLKSWKSSFNIFSRQVGNIDQSKEYFGKWPQDILTRCLCILALDRFGDYSGSTIRAKKGETLSNKKNVAVIGAAMTAPVREVAARVLSFLLEMAPKDQIQKPCYRVMVKLVQYQSEWEVRHGSMLGFKFVAQVIGASKNKIGSSHQFDKIWNNISSHAYRGLQDKFDDVKGTSAQVLNCFIVKRKEGSNFTPDQKKKSAEIITYVGRTWAALQQVQNTSSCTLDLLNLFSSMISNNSEAIWTSIGSMDAEELLRKMNDFLYFDDYSVRLRCFESLAIIAEPIAFTLVQESTKRTEDQSIHIYCSLIVNLFESFVNDPYCIYEENNDEITNHENNTVSNIDVIIAARENAWVAVIDASLHLMKNENLPLIRETTTMLLFRFIHLDFSQNLQMGRKERYMIMEYDLKSKTSTYHRNLHLAAKAFIVYYKRSSTLIDTDSLIASFVLCLLESPFSEFCEVGCVLLKFVTFSKEDKNCFLISTFSPLLLAILQKGANCMRLDHHEKISCIRTDTDFIRRCFDTFKSTMVTVLQRQDNLTPSSDLRNEFMKKIFHMWTNILRDFDIDLNQCVFDSTKKSKEHMRLFSSITGTIISFGPNRLPSKLTYMVRTLMTSTKNEDATFRAQVACEDLVNMIQLLRQASKPQVVNKIIDNICKLASYDPQLGQLPQDFTKFGMKSSREILKLIVKSIPKNQDLTNEEILWGQLKCLRSERPALICQNTLAKALVILSEVSYSFIKGTKTFDQVISDLLPTSTLLSCRYTDTFVRQKAVIATTNISNIDPLKSIPIILPFLFQSLNASDDDAQRLGACNLMSHLVDKSGVALLPFVRYLLPASMSMMTDPIERCSKSAASTFAKLVRLAPLVSTDSQEQKSCINYGDESFQQIVDHLIHGKALPPSHLPNLLLDSLTSSGIKLRDYQKEGISWMIFLRTLNLNGALVDEMGLGKTLQALCTVAASHLQQTKILSKQKEIAARTRSLIVCPSSVVGHWMNEIRRIDKDSKIFKPMRYSGISRAQHWKDNYDLSNIIITSYSTLRSDVDILTSVGWKYCVLDEGHLIKNPKTLTAKAAQRIRSKHKLLLSGSPVQNKVQELWAIFNWLMPNYLGSNSDFAERFGRDISKGQLGGSASNIRKGMKKLKILHQQVLPFILRRVKSDVLQQLPPKIITDVPCSMSKEQSSLYNKLSNESGTKTALESLQSLFEKRTADNSSNGGQDIKLGKETLKSIMYLRMLCTHPLLLKSPLEDTGESFTKNQFSLNRYNASGKISTLKDLLTTAGIFDNDITGADYDQSLIYIENFNDVNISNNDVSNTFEYDDDMVEGLTCEKQPSERNESKCLIFAQFTQSLDILEELLFKPLMPSFRYVRLDGRVEGHKRDMIVEHFVNDESIKCLLLTTKVGSLGLNLQVADTVIFLEPDYNPHVDLQAMDRVHRIGQDKTVKVYRLITTDSIEEKIMSLQKAKLEISDAIVNTDNSTMFSMGTDKMLDLFDTS